MNKFITIILLILVVIPHSSFARKIKDHDPILIVSIFPNYPRSAAEQGIEGSVTIEFTVNTMGSVEDPKVITSTPVGIFDKEALRAILKFKFAPKIVKKKTVKSRVVQTIKFKLPDEFKK
jgi:protein TonB